MAKNKKVVFLNLFKIAFPITAIVSIGHRISGFFLFLTIPVILWILSSSFSSEQSYNAIASGFSDFFWLIAIVILAFVYHLCAGLRHLLMDLGLGDDNFEIAKKSAIGLIVISIVVFVLII